MRTLAELVEKFAGRRPPSQEQAARLCEEETRARERDEFHTMTSGWARLTLRLEAAARRREAQR